MRVVAALLALALALFATSCSRRERANPLDAANPDTGGAPQGFNAIADVASVKLRWIARPELAIDGYQIFRLTPGDPMYHALTDVLPSDISQIVDATAQSGIEYHYRIHYVIRGELGAVWAEDVARPGPLLPWVVDAGRGRLLRLSPDGRDIAAGRTGFDAPDGLAVTPGMGPVWVADELAGSLQIFDPGTLIGRPVVGVLDAPAAVALDPINGTAWVCDRSQGAVFHFQSDGNIALPASLAPLDDPAGIATDPRDGSVWVTQFEGNEVRLYLQSGFRVGERPLLAPARVAVDSTNGVAWVTSIASGWVWRLSPSLAVIDSFRLQSPVGVALDWRRRTAWICDVDGDVVVAMNMDTLTERFRVGGLGNPWDVAVDFASGEAWVVARGSARAFRLSTAGAQLASVPALGDPFAIRIDPGVAGPLTRP
jgi:DNA-binding beta-propeller fold protein YncE